MSWWKKAVLSLCLFALWFSGLIVVGGKATQVSIFGFPVVLSRFASLWPRFGVFAPQSGIGRPLHFS